jgi:2'-5' RNA ligase
MFDQAAESVLLIPVPETTALLHPYRLRFDPEAAGVIEHITLLYPFLSPSHIDGGVLAHLRALFSSISSFPFALRATAWFEPDILYLAPDPVEPFIELTNRLVREFGVLPYAGRYPTVDPHLTVARHGDISALQQVADVLAGHLPIKAHAHQAWLMTGHPQIGWLPHHCFPFAGTQF